MSPPALSSSLDPLSPPHTTHDSIPVPPSHQASQQPSLPGPSAPGRPKSPPLAFEPSPHDAVIQPSPSAHAPPLTDPLTSPSVMGRLSPLGGLLDLQAIVDQQANAIKLLHDAFAAERQVWRLEKDRMYQRIASLEDLLKTRDHQRCGPNENPTDTTYTLSPAVDLAHGLTRRSPAKSPSTSPGLYSGPLSPQSRSHAPGYVLPTIAEAELTPSLSSRREGAPRSIDLPTQPQISESRRSSSRRRPSVSFIQGNNQSTVVEEIPFPARVVSPPPLAHRIMAGHTPVRLTRPPTPPPQKMSIEGIEDTPTRNNTHINALLTQGTEEEADAGLSGPLHMPELPHAPDDTNFTFEMLARKLERLGQHPEAARPFIFSQPTPGVASPVNERDGEPEDGSSTVLPDNPPPDSSASTALSPSAIPVPSSRPSPNSALPSALSPEESHEVLKHGFEQGGIRLKKKPSVNFGAPLGTLAGFGNFH